MAEQVTPYTCYWARHMMLVTTACRNTKTRPVGEIGSAIKTGLYAADCPVELAAVATTVIEWTPVYACT